MPGPLEGIQVLDLSRILAGPWASQLLADYGAEVIKVEKPGEGDDTRRWGPPFLAQPDGHGLGESAYFLSANRGKRSVTIDFSQPEGQALVRGLSEQCDVLLENFKVGGLAKYGLAYADLRVANPGLVYCSISAFGQDGPDRDGPGYDAMIQGTGGLMSITGAPDGQAGAGPQRTGVAIADLMTGMYAVSAILAALFHRRESGKGQHIDLALLDTQVAALANQAMNFFLSGHSPVRQGTAHPNIVPYQAFQTRDGHIMIAVGNDTQFAALAVSLGEPGWSSDPRFATNVERVAHREVLVALISERLDSGTSADWLNVLRARKVPCGPINDIEQVFEEPQVKHRRMRVELKHPFSQRLPGVRNPVLFSDTPLAFDMPPPLLGQHTEEVLHDRLGLSPEELARLRKAGVI